MSALAGKVDSGSPADWSSEVCGAALADLLRTTIQHESAISARDAEIEAIRRKHSQKIEMTWARKAQLEMRLEEYWTSNRPTDNKAMQFDAGTIGARAASNPALVPLNAKWDWEKVARRVKRIFGASRFFHPPKPAALDKVALKKALDAEKLATCGLKLDDSENFYIDLNRLAEAA